MRLGVGVELVAHTGASSNPCRARKGALKGAALRGLRPEDATRVLQGEGELVAHTDASWNQIAQFLRDRLLSCQATRSYVNLRGVASVLHRGNVL